MKFTPMKKRRLFYAYVENYRLVWFSFLFNWEIKTTNTYTFILFNQAQRHFRGLSWVIWYRSEFFFSNPFMRNKLFFLGACVYMIFFSEVACVSPSGSVLQEFFFSAVVVCTNFFVQVCLQDIFFKIPPSEVEWSTPKYFPMANQLKHK